MFDTGSSLETFMMIFGFAFGLVFTLWPLLLLSPLQGRGHHLSKMLFAWLLLAVMRVFLFFSSVPALFVLVPEPLNTILFLAAGILLVGGRAGQNLWRRKRLQHMGDAAGAPGDLLDLSPRQFEEMVVEFYRAAGHRAKRTGAIGDHGVDVVVQTNDGEKWVVQCKRWRGKVGEPVMRDFYGTAQHEKADKGVVITTGRFTRQAREWARGKPIILYDGDEFLRRWRHARLQWGDGRPPVPAESVAAIPLEPAGIADGGSIAGLPLCPRCGAPMVLRTAGRGQYKGKRFYGCPNYPECREILPFE